MHTPIVHMKGPLHDGPFYSVAHSKHSCYLRINTTFVSIVSPLFAVI